MSVLLFSLPYFIIISTANKGWSIINYYQSSAFDCWYLSCNDHCDRWFFQKIFFYLKIILNELEFVFLEFKHLQNTQNRPCFIFICSFFTCYFIIILCINYCTAYKDIGLFFSFIAHCFAITLCINALHLLWLLHH